MVGSAGGREVQTLILHNKDEHRFHASQLHEACVSIRATVSVAYLFEEERLTCSLP